MPWKREAGKRHPVIREIDLALAAAMAREWSGIEINVRWPRYEVIVRSRLGVAPDRDVCMADRDKRPLKAYRAFSLVLMEDGKIPDERVSGFDGKGFASIPLVPEPD